MKGEDALRIVEAAYRLDATDADWLSNVAEACRPVLDSGFGLCVFQFHHRMGSPPRIDGAIKLGIPTDLAKIYADVFRQMDPGVQERPFIHGPCTTGSQMMGMRSEFENNEHMRRYAHRFGMYDSIWITAAEPSGTGCGIHAGRPRIAWASRAERQRWARVAAHLSAGARLRRTLADPQPSSAASTAGVADAVLSPDGRLLHAEGWASEPEAVEQLRKSVLDVEKVKGSARRQGVMTSLAGWPGLIAGRWSLIDEFDAGGRRYVVARENRPRPPGPAALTLRERQVVGYAALGHDNKVIAYDLGIAHATVRVLMARAATKLGAHSRAEAVSVYLSACANAPAPPAMTEDERGGRPAPLA